MPDRLVTYRRAAFADLAAIEEYTEREFGVQHADRYVGSLMGFIENNLQNPEHHQLIEDNLRRAVHAEYYIMPGAVPHRFIVRIQQPSICASLYRAPTDRPRNVL